MDKRAFTTALAKYAVNPPVRALFRLKNPRAGHSDPRDHGPQVGAASPDTGDRRARRRGVLARRRARPPRRLRAQHHREPTRPGEARPPVARGHRSGHAERRSPEATAPHRCREARCRSSTPRPSWRCRRTCCRSGSTSTRRPEPPSCLDPRMRGEDRIVGHLLVAPPGVARRSARLDRGHPPPGHGVPGAERAARGPHRSLALATTGARGRAGRRHRRGAARGGRGARPERPLPAGELAQHRHPARRRHLPDLPRGPDLPPGARTASAAHRRPRRDRHLALLAAG